MLNETSSGRAGPRQQSMRALDLPDVEGTHLGRKRADPAFPRGPSLAASESGGKEGFHSGAATFGATAPVDGASDVPFGVCFEPSERLSFCRIILGRAGLRRSPIRVLLGEGFCQVVLQRP